VDAFVDKKNSPEIPLVRFFHDISNYRTPSAKNVHMCYKSNKIFSDPIEKNSPT